MIQQDSLKKAYNIQNELLNSQVESLNNAYNTKKDSLMQLYQKNLKN
jgi:hypothetical protein